MEELEGSSTASLEGTENVPTLQQLNAHVRPLIADVWYDLGLQLFDPEDKSRLDIIKANKPGDADGACTEMFSLWLQKYPSASWNSLISAIRGPGVDKHNAACEIERKIFQPATAHASDLLISSVDRSPSLNYSEIFCSSKSVGAAYASLTSNLCTVLKRDSLPSLKLALNSQLTVPGINIGKQLSKAIKSAKTSDDLLSTLQQSSCCNWLDTRLLEALACGSTQPAAYELVKAYEKFLHSTKLNNVLSWFSKSKVQEPYASRVGTKFGINPSNITVGMLLKRRGDLEDVILNLGKGIVNINHVKEGCLEIICSIPRHCSFIAYKNALHNRHKFERISLLYLTCSAHPVIYDPWLFDLEENSANRKEIFHEHEVATQLCSILLENVPVDDIITVFSSHDLLMGDDLTVVTNAPSDYLKKMFLLRLFQNVSLSVWSTICDVVNKDDILQHIGDDLVKVFDQNPSEISTDNWKDEESLVIQAIYGRGTTKSISVDDSEMIDLPHYPLSLQRSSFHQLHCHKHLKPSTVEAVFQYTVRHVTELLSCCDPELLIKWCENLMASDTHQIKLFTVNFVDKIRQLKASPAILKMLSHYWTWSNYSILKVLAQFSKLALDLLEEFGTRLNTMLPITEYPIKSVAVSMFPYDTTSYTVLTLECDHKLNHSLQLVYDMQSLITENCDITQHALLLLAVDQTRLHWMIPKSVVTIVNTRVMECSQILFSKGVIRTFIYPSIACVIDATQTVWPYIFLNENEDATKMPRPPNDQLRMLQYVRKERDRWYVRAKQSEEAEEKFRTGYEREEQKYKELKERKAKELEMVPKFNEKFASCKESLELTIKDLTGDTKDLPTVAGPTKEFMQMESVQQLEHDLENLEQLTKHLLHKSVEHREEQSKSLKQLEQKLLQKEKEIEDMKSEMLAKDGKLDDFKKKEKELIKMSSDLKLQNNQLKMQLLVLKESNAPGGLFSGPVNIKWKEGAPAPMGRLRHTAVWLNELVYVGGGLESHYNSAFTINCYDPNSNSWKSPIQTPYCDFSMTELNNNLLIAGGCSKDYKKTNQILTMDAGQLKNYTKMITARSDATATGYRGMLIITGGEDDKGKTLSSTEMFDSSDGQWYVCNDLPQPHLLLRSVIVDNILYLLGGFNQDNDPSPSVFTASLDTVSRHQIKWAIHQDLDTPWYRSTPVNVQGIDLLLLGGRDNSYTTTSVVYKLNKANRSWEDIGHIPSATDGSAAVSTADNRIIVIGGWNGTTGVTNTVWIGSCEPCSSN